MEWGIRPSRMWARWTPCSRASTQHWILGDHAPADDAAGQQGGHLFPADLVDQRTVVLGVPEDAPDVGEEDELFRPQEMASSAAAVSALML